MTQYFKIYHKKRENTIVQLASENNVTGREIEESLSESE